MRYAVPLVPIQPAPVERIGRLRIGDLLTSIRIGERAEMAELIPAPVRDQPPEFHRPLFHELSLNALFAPSPLVELSARTLDNWVAKSANLLVEEYDAGPGSRVAVRLPPHWRTVTWLLVSDSRYVFQFVGPIVSSRRRSVRGS